MSAKVIDLARRRRVEALRRRYGPPIEDRSAVLRRMREHYPHVFGPPEDPDKAALTNGREWEAPSFQ